MLRPSAATAACVLLGLGASAIAQPTFTRLGTYTTGLAVPASEITAAETAALKDGKLYVSNAFDVSVDIVDVSNPNAPTLIKRVDLLDYGAQVNSVAVSSLGLVAVAVEAPVKTDKGNVVFLMPDGTIVGVAKVGALPDMVTFTPDGTKLLVANEGEPICYGVGCFDPKAQISIVTTSPIRAQPAVRQVEFDKVAIPAEVRIYGPNAKPHEDLEPEYIAITPDGQTAFVTLQENNAIAEIDIQTAKVTSVRGLGYKDMNVAPTVQTFAINGLPSIGSTAAGQPLDLGGFSSLFFEGKTADGKLKFATNTDRGPNGEPIATPTGEQRPFLLPDFTPRIVRLELDPETGDVAITQQIPLQRSDGTLLSGRPNIEIVGGGPNTPYNDEVPIDLLGNVLTRDPLGGDFEGLVVDAAGTFWISDEYRPAIYRFAADGKLMARYIPIGTHTAAGVAYTPGTAGPFGTEALPAVLGKRRQNRGIEGIALQNGLIYAFVQSPIRNPASLSNGVLNANTVVRIVELNPTSLATKQFLYVMDNEAATGNGNTRADKIGDAVALPNRGFLVLERDDDAAPEDPVANIRKRVYAFNLTGATTITPANDVLYGGRALDQMTAAELQAAGIVPVTKVLHVDLAKTAYNIVEKVEGLAVVDADTIALVNDNDFTVAQINIDFSTGTFTRAPGYDPEPEILALIDTVGFDASDRDNVINIRGWPVWGMYLPDGIATYTAGGQRFLVTANEGDTRAWEGFNEEATAASLAALYPSIPEVAVQTQLGRLTVTNTPPLADFSRPYLFGTRSFSIWNAATGAQVFDSGDDLEVRTAAAFPGNFNSNNTANNFDNRSDNKGPEPEGVDVGEIDGHSYAFIALERIGGVAVYEVTDPVAATFVQYFNDRSFSGSSIGRDAGAEVVHFVPAAESPTGGPVVIVANEISGTVSLWGLAN